VLAGFHVKGIKHEALLELAKAAGFVPQEKDDPDAQHDELYDWLWSHHNQTNFQILMDDADVYVGALIADGVDDYEVFKMKFDYVKLNEYVCKAAAHLGIAVDEAYIYAGVRAS
jgi:hypothetical protein